MSERLPWSKFSWSDWENDPALALVSMAAQGFWMRLLCIAIKEDGYVLIGGECPSNEKLAKLTRSTPDEVSGWLAELASENVFSRNGRGVIYSRRIVRDIKISRTAQKNGKLGGNPSLRKITEKTPQDNPPRNPRLKPEKKREDKKREEVTPQPPRGSEGTFDEAFASYPQTGRSFTHREAALGEWLKACEIETPDRLIGAVKTFAASDVAAEQGGRRVPKFERWLREARYSAWLLPHGATQGSSWAGPPDVRSAVVKARGDPFAVSWLDRCVWRDLPTKSITSASPTVIDRLRKEVGSMLEDMGISLALVDEGKAA